MTVKGNKQIKSAMLDTSFFLRLLDAEDALYDGACLIEWPERMGGYLPRDMFRVEFQPEGEGRKISISTTSAEKRQRLAQLGEGAR